MRRPTIPAPWAGSESKADSLLDRYLTGGALIAAFRSVERGGCEGERVGSPLIADFDKI